MNSIDTVQIHFSESGQQILMLVLAFIMFGIALDIDKSKFIELQKNPKPILVGLFAHWFLLPLATIILVYIIQPQASIALGMFLVAACPSGNMATYITTLSKGNKELSISISTVIALTCFFTTPVLFFAMANTYPKAVPLFKSIQINIWKLIAEIGLILALPMLAAILLKIKYPTIISKIKKPINVLSFFMFILFLIIAFIINRQIFIDNFTKISWIVAIHNAIGFLIGFITAKIFNLKIADAKTISIECGIQNTGLGLVLIFSFFNGLGGMALIAAWWGIYHILAGSLLSLYFRKK
jgi:BASS family bile acid:Na+ symporter